MLDILSAYTLGLMMFCCFDCSSRDSDNFINLMTWVFIATMIFVISMILSMLYFTQVGTLQLLN